MIQVFYHSISKIRREVIIQESNKIKLLPFPRWINHLSSHLWWALLKYQGRINNQDNSSLQFNIHSHKMNIQKINSNSRNSNNKDKMNINHRHWNKVKSTASKGISKVRSIQSNNKIISNSNNTWKHKNS